jgi:AcrR family transcriptional regulator
MVTSRYNSPLRDDAAAATRAKILDHARRLFLERGYAAVTVPEIARAARVATQTVYASTGGKTAIFTSLLQPIVDDPEPRQANAAVRATSDPGEIVSIAAGGTRRIHERYQDIIFGLVRKAPGEPAAQQALDTAVARCISGLKGIAERLVELGVVEPHLGVDGTVDLLWFYFGQNAWYSLVDDRGWSFDRAEQWLSKEALRALTSPAS